MELVAPAKKIFIVDDHPLIRRGLRQLFEGDIALSISGEADSVATAMVKIRKELPDLVIVDISLPDGSGFDLIKRLHALQPQLPVLVCSMYEERFFTVRSLRAGARGYVSKLEAPEHLLNAIKAILAGKNYVGKALEVEELEDYLGTDTAPFHHSPVEALTNREFEVFEQIGSGYGTAQIAQHLNLSVKTVETHRLHIKRKLKISTSSELTRHALHWAMRDIN